MEVPEETGGKTMDWILTMVVPDELVMGSVKFIFTHLLFVVWH